MKILIIKNSIKLLKNYFYLFFSRNLLTKLEKKTPSNKIKPNQAIIQKKKKMGKDKPAKDAPKKPSTPADAKGGENKDAKGGNKGAGSDSGKKKDSSKSK